MPQFQTSLNNIRTPLLVTGRPEYLLGSFADTVAITRLQVTSVACTANVITLGVTVREGNIPAVASLISVAATTTDSGAANVTNVALSAVSINAITGVGTVSYAATAGNQATTPDSGYAVVNTPEVAEALVNEASIACAIQADIGPDVTIRFDVTFPSIPTTCTVTAQSADFYDPTGTQFLDLGTVASVAGGVVSGGTVQFVLEKSLFVRFKITSVAGGASPSIIGKVTI